MRERIIKFRAWDGTRMLNNIGVHPSISMVNEGYNPEDDGGMTISPKMKSYHIMQFTGLHDKHGVQIYEGDIVSNSAANWEVIFNTGCFCGRIVSPKIRKDNDIHIALRAIKEIEIIGNIHTTPSLI